MNEHTKRKTELAHILDEAANVRAMLEQREGRKLTDAEIEAMALGGVDDDEDDEPPLDSELEDDDEDELEDVDDDGEEDGLDYDELDDTCPRSSSA